VISSARAARLFRSRCAATSSSNTIGFGASIPHAKVAPPGPKPGSESALSALRSSIPPPDGPCRRGGWPDRPGAGRSGRVRRPRPEGLAAARAAASRSLDLGDASTPSSASLSHSPVRARRALGEGPVAAAVDLGLQGQQRAGPGARPSGIRIRPRRASRAVSQTCVGRLRRSRRRRSAGACARAGPCHRRWRGGRGRRLAGEHQPVEKPAALGGRFKEQAVLGRGQPNRAGHGRSAGQAARFRHRPARSAASAPAESRRPCTEAAPVHPHRTSTCGRHGPGSARRLRPATAARPRPGSSRAGPCPATAG
jgi:hypothetical protein